MRPAFWWVIAVIMTLWVAFGVVLIVAAVLDRTS